MAVLGKLARRISYSTRNIDYLDRYQVYLKRFGYRQNGWSAPNRTWTGLIPVGSLKMGLEVVPGTNGQNSCRYYSVHGNDECNLEAVEETRETSSLAFATGSAFPSV